MHTYGLVRQPVDPRDKKLMFMRMGELPEAIDLREKCPSVFNQLSTNSCTANAGIAARMMLSSIQTPLSRLYLYYHERKLEGTEREDSGATMRSICKALNKVGVCEETRFPFSEGAILKSPCILDDINAAKYRIGSYRTFDSDTTEDVYQIKQYLATMQQPVLIGMDVYESFESPVVAQTGIVPIPNKDTEKYMGGHAVLIVGYDDSMQMFIVRNSWGEKWGDKGYFYLPYNFLTLGFAFDSWVIS